MTIRLHAVPRELSPAAVEFPEQGRGLAGRLTLRTLLANPGR